MALKIGLNNQILLMNFLTVLELKGGNQTRSAEQLQNGSAKLYRELKSYGIIGDKRAGPKGARSKS